MNKTKMIKRTFSQRGMMLAVFLVAALLLFQGCSRSADNGSGWNGNSPSKTGGPDKDGGVTIPSDKDQFKVPEETKDGSVVHVNKMPHLLDKNPLSDPKVETVVVKSHGAVTVLKKDQKKKYDLDVPKYPKSLVIDKMYMSSRLPNGDIMKKTAINLVTSDKPEKVSRFYTAALKEAAAKNRDGSISVTKVKMGAGRTPLITTVNIRRMADGTTNISVLK